MEVLTKDKTKNVHLNHLGVRVINIAVFGKGLVGNALIHQILEQQDALIHLKKIKLNIFSIADSKKVFLTNNQVNSNWKALLEKSTTKNTLNSIIAYARELKLKNLIAIDNTANANFVKNYIPLIEAGFNIISSNKIANTLSFDFYHQLRTTLKIYKKQYLYETNVGAGLPVIDTIRLLHESGDVITKIRGVFSGSLSYVFNTFSAESKSFSNVLQEAVCLGYTEPDPREDLKGIDVARKLLILARELDLKNELAEVNVQNLIPDLLREGTKEDFLAKLSLMNLEFQAKKEAQKSNHVLRYIGELSGDLSKEKGVLDVKLVSIPANTPLGSLKGADAIFEIYTSSYGAQPIVVQGAGAGAEVTARGVFGDVLRLAKQMH